MSSLEPITAITKVVPRKSKINTIDTFEELDKYITVLTSILDYIDRFVGHPFFTDYSHNGRYNIVKKTHGVDGYCLTLVKDGIELASVGYYNLDPEDTSWTKVDLSGTTHIYGFPQENQSTYSYYDACDSLEADVEYNIADYNETMYTQLEFVYSKAQVNGAMCMAKLAQSDPNRKYRQFVIYEYPSRDFNVLLEDLKDYIFERTVMLAKGF